MGNIKEDKNTKLGLIRHSKERGLPGTSFQQQIKRGKDYNTDLIYNTSKILPVIFFYNFNEDKLYCIF